MAKIYPRIARMFKTYHSTQYANACIYQVPDIFPNCLPHRNISFDEVHSQIWKSHCDWCKPEKGRFWLVGSDFKSTNQQRLPFSLGEVHRDNFQYIGKWLRWLIGSKYILFQLHNVHFHMGQVKPKLGCLNLFKIQDYWFLKIILSVRFSLIW